MPPLLFVVLYSAGRLPHPYACPRAAEPPPPPPPPPPGCALSMPQGLSDPNKLGTVEQYFKEIMHIPRLQKRIEAFVFSRTFKDTKAKVDHHLGILQAACKELSECDDFVKVLEATLAVGNHLNQQGKNGQAAGFKLDTLLKLVDVKGKDKSTSLLHFVVRELMKTSETVKTLSEQMSNIKPASGLQVHPAGRELQGLAGQRQGLSFGTRVWSPPRVSLPHLVALLCR